MQLQVDPYNSEANELVHRIAPAKERRDMAEYYYQQGDFNSAIGMLSDAIDTSPWAYELFERRADLHLENGDALAAVADLRASTKLQSDSTDGYFRLSNLLYQLGHASDALKSIRECLKLDPEHKRCFPFYKKIKKVRA